MFLAGAFAFELLSFLGVRIMRLSGVAGWVFELAGVLAGASAFEFLPSLGVAGVTRLGILGSAPPFEFVGVFAGAFAFELALELTVLLLIS